MKLLPIFLFALFVSIRSQADFYAIFDFGMPSVNGMTKDGFDLYTNMLDETDSSNFFRAKNINYTKARSYGLNIDYDHDVTTPNHSLLVVFDNSTMSRRRLPSRQPAFLTDTFTYSVYLSDTMVGVDLVLQTRNRIFMGKISDPNAIMAMAVNFQSEGNSTNATVYYIDSNNYTKSSNMNYIVNSPSLTEATSISAELYLENYYYVALSHKEITRAFFEKWVGTLFAAHRAGNETLTCQNCQPSRACPEHSTFVMSTTSMRNYSCVCQGEYLPYIDKTKTSNCVLLSPKEKCDESCNDTCIEADPFLCYKRCASGYKRQRISGDFVKCTAPIPERSKSTWSYVTLVFMPILAAGYIIVAIILFCICRKTSSFVNTQAGYSTSSMENVAIGSPKAMKVQKKEFENENYGETGSRDSKVRMETKTPYMPKIEEEKANDPKVLSEPKEEEMENLVIGTCKMCGETNKGLITMYKCGHQNICKECAAKAKECPTCGNEDLV